MSTAEPFTCPFEPLQLSENEAKQLEELARLLIAPVMDQFEEHIQDPHRHLDATRWKLVKEREDVHVYKERSARRRHGSAAHDRMSTSSSSTTSEMDSIPTREIPVLLTVGTIQGDLNDTMYGVTNPTTDAMRIKTAYIQDGVINAAVLARLREPTTDDPFHSLSVKWSIKGQALHLRTLINNRDLVYLEATGLGRLPKTGEVVGYQLLHSIEFQQTHSIPGCSRGKLSIVGLYRQHRKGVVEMFGKGFVDPSGRIARALVVKSAADAMLSPWRTIQTAQRKKLAFALRNARRRGSSLDPSQRNSTATSKACAICSNALSSIAPLTFGKKRYASHCQLCLRVICTTCRVKKELASIGPDRWLDMHTVPFCVACVDRVTKTSAFDIASEELVQKNGHRGFNSVGTSRSTAETQSEMTSENALRG